MTGSWTASRKRLLLALRHPLQTLLSLVVLVLTPALNVALEEAIKHIHAAEVPLDLHVGELGCEWRAATGQERVGESEWTSSTSMFVHTCGCDGERERERKK